MTMKKNMREIGLDDIKIERILDICGSLNASSGFMTAIELSTVRQQIFKLSTGSKRLNQLLGGGIEPMSITEVFGEFGSGKTQLAHTLCVTAQMPGSNGYVGGKVIFIDTEHTFRPDRLRPIADRYNLNQTKVLENVLYARAYNSEHQFNLLNNVAAKMHQEPGFFKLLIIDSIMALFRVDYTGMGELADRQNKLGQMLSRLQKMSEEYNIAVFITNQIVSDFSAMKDEAKPVGGHVMAHSSTTRIALKKGIGNRRFAHLFDSPEFEAEETKFAITTGGIDDCKD
ncbi:meiotic recombination protein DMC1/LIM15 homolog isoform X2 [Atheta coriaria]